MGDLVFLYRVAKVKRAHAQSELVQWFVHYLQRDTPEPEAYAKQIELIEKGELEKAEKVIGMIRKLVG